jgi:hypothetical protein
MSALSFLHVLPRRTTTLVLLALICAQPALAADGPTGLAFWWEMFGLPGFLNW